MREEVRRARLYHVARRDVLRSRVANVPNGEDDRGRGRGPDGAKVLREGEDGPAVLGGTERGVLCVGQFAVVDELCADDCVLASLVSDTGRLARVLAKRPRADRGETHVVYRVERGAVWAM